MKIRLIVFVLFILFLAFFSQLNSKIVFATTKGDFTYEAKNKIITITGYTGNDKDIEIPGIDYFIDDDSDYDALEISSETFKGKELTSVTFPKADEYFMIIGESSFSNNKLSKVYFPEEVYYLDIGESAFAHNNLTEIKFPKGIQNIGVRSFSHNNIQKITIPKNSATFPLDTQMIGTNVFLENLNKKTVIIQNDKLKMGSFIFDFENSQADVTIYGFDPSTAKDYALKVKREDYIYENNTFKNIFELDFNYTEDNGTAILTEYTGQYTEFATNVVIPNTIGDDVVVNELKDELFTHKLTSVVIRNNVETFGNNVFKGNKDQPEELIIYGFKGSAAEKYANTNSHTFIDIIERPEYIFDWKENSKDGMTVDGVRIATYKGIYADVVIPDQLGGFPVTEIQDKLPGSGVFENKSIKSIALPDSLTKIGDSAFAGNQLTEIDIPSDVTSIGKSAFANNQLTSVVIPKSITAIEANAFTGNQSNPIDFIIYGTKDSVAKTYADENGHTFIDITTIADYEWEENDSGGVTITEYKGNNTILIIPRELGGLPVTEIQNQSPGVFENKGITSVTLPDTLKQIGDSAFSNNELEVVVIPDSVTAIGENAFSGNQTNSIDFIIYGTEDSVAKTYADENGYTFIDMTTINDYEWEKNDSGGITITGYIGDDKVITIPSRLDGLPVTVIDNASPGVFENKGITSITLPNNLKHIGNSAFANNDLSKIDIPNGVTTIGDSAFANNKLKEVIIPDSVTTIGENTFSGNQANPTHLIIYGQENSVAKTYAVENNHTYKNIANHNDSNGNGQSNPTRPTPNPENNRSDETKYTEVEVLVNGTVEYAGSATTKELNGQQITTISINEEKILDRLQTETEREQPIMTIPFTTNSDVAIGELNGRIVKNMENIRAVIEIKTEQAIYSLPAEQINIDSISKKFGQEVELQDILVQIEISTPSNDTIEVVKDAANRDGLTLIVPPLNFKINAVYEDKTEEVTKFNTYVERSIALPHNVDPNQITTGVVVESDGTFRHVPTKIMMIDGVYYAHINSLTNSTYSIIWNPIEFSDVADHWARHTVNNMGSRMIVNGVSQNQFKPDRDITRAEFTAMMLRGLGLKPEEGESYFSDVNETDWYYGVINAAYEYELIQGFEDGSFRPNENITREQAMVIIANAMNMTKLQGQFQIDSPYTILNQYNDISEISSWALSAVSNNVRAGIITGRSDSKLAPKESITRAEVATIIERLLQASELI